MCDDTGTKGNDTGTEGFRDGSRDRVELRVKFVLNHPSMKRLRITVFVPYMHACRSSVIL